jgi:predicted ATP-grasp superfamily ATP-dependent carboligase
MTQTPDPPAILIAALSARALAACARRAGFRPLVVDLLGGDDTRDIAEMSLRVPGSLGQGLDPAALLAALDRLAAGRAPVGVVVGNGFEDRTALLGEIAARHALLGNPPAVVAAIKDPFAFAALCARAAIPHPETRPDLPAEGAWLRKRIGGSGGAHIVAAPQRALAGSGEYYQRRVGGVPVSAAFLAAHGAARVLGLSRQWADPGSRRPFRYGGAVRPAGLPPARAADIVSAVERVVGMTTGLRGLNSADFLVRDDGIDLLEINPRPGATVDILADPAGSLFRLHLDACAGRLPDAVPGWPDAAAAALVYARADIRVPDAFAWPSWAADRPPPGATIPRGAPFCTVLASAPTAAAAETILRGRRAAMLASLDGQHKSA